MLFVMLAPLLLCIGVAVWTGKKFYYLNFASLHEVNIKELGRAKLALQQSLRSVEAIERELKGKVDSYEMLQKQLEELQTVKDIDTLELQKKLSAIEAASRHSVLFQRIIGFAIGVLSSLLATYIWERLIAI